MSAEGVSKLLALAAIAGIALLVAVRLEVLAPWVTVGTDAGPVRVVNALAGIDHPFHAARAEVLRRSILAGEIPRWIGSHQQGYPVEFYPLGAAWLAVGAWTLSLGTLPIGWAHGVAVAFVLLLPVVAFWLLARRDGLPLGTAALALAAHVAVPGAWWHGGYTELVQWGLVTNVAGAAWAFVGFALLVRWIGNGRGLDGALAMAAAAAAVLTNPRSAFGLVVLWLAAVLAILAGLYAANRHEEVGRGDTDGCPSSRSGAAIRVIGRALVAGVGALLLAAPELVSLARFSGLYVFKHYGEYADARAFLDSSIAAVSPPVFVAAVVGVAAAWTPLGRDRPGTRAAALALPLYAALTWGVAVGALPVGQLEPTRLMPLQRLLAVWLAAAAVGMALDWLVGRKQSWTFAGSPSMGGVPSRADGPTEQPNRQSSPTRGDARRLASIRIAASLVPVALGFALLGSWLRPGGEAMPLPGPPEAPDRGLYAVARTGDRSFVDLERAIRAADAAAPPGTAILVLGSALSWHEQLWAPLWSDRPFLYDDWLWFWRSDHAGTPGYAFDRGHFYPDPERALDRDYLDRFGIGAVVATGSAAAVAAATPWLEGVSGETGNGGADPAPVYDAWRVIEPTTLVTVGGANVDGATWSNGAFGGRATATGEAVIRHAWFPRWRATVGDAERVPVQRRDGTMRLADAPAGAQVELRYRTDLLDWAARACSVAGVALAASVVVGRRADRSLGRRRR